MYHIMIDIETTGTRPDLNGILQIAAVPFDLVKREIGMNMFARAMWTPPRRYWDEDTRRWWMNQNQEVFAKIQEDAQEPRLIMTEFAEWVKNEVGILDACFWAKPITFDFTFVSSYFHEFGIANPFHYRNARDVNTWIEAKTNASPWDTWNKVETVGDKHNALHDCIWQITGLFKALEPTDDPLVQAAG
jgi:oligoribonuclease (3'-5' exoribonuclease)